MDYVIYIIIYIVPLISLAYFLGNYIYKVFVGEKVIFSKWLQPVENKIYEWTNINTSEMSGRRYFVSLLLLSIFSFLFLMLLLLCQQFLPLNPEQMKGISFTTAFNIACSFITNTNWQNYMGENSLSYLTQMLGITVQNFLSAAVGIAVLFVLIRGITQKEQKTIGNFWVDITKIILYILLPVCIITSVIFVGNGVVQTFSKYEKIITLEGKEQRIPLGPVASQIAIKQLGTNGGGYFGQNSAYPLENPNVITNYIQSILILLIPMSLFFTFGKAIKKKKEGLGLLIAIFILFGIAMATVISFESISHNWEGKETRFGIINSSIWSVFTTAASNGSVNSMHDSYTPISIMVQMLLMGVGEVIFGGVGSGLYTLLAFVLITVFVAGLMVGRTPEYLGKKIEPFEMKMAILIILTTPFCILITSGVLTLLPNIMQNLANTGPHAFSELLYGAISAGANNGSSMAGFQSNTVFVNLILGISMLIARFVPIYAVIRVAQSLSTKKKIPVTSGTLDTSKPVFLTLLVIIILIIGTLSFFPAMALGPLAEFMQ